MADCLTTFWFGPEQRKSMIWTEQVIELKFYHAMSLCIYHSSSALHFSPLDFCTQSKILMLQMDAVDGPLFSIKFYWNIVFIWFSLCHLEFGLHIEWLLWFCEIGIDKFADGACYGRGKRRDNNIKTCAVERNRLFACRSMLLINALEFQRWYLGARTTNHSIIILGKNQHQLNQISLSFHKSNLSVNMLENSFIFELCDKIDDAISHAPCYKPDVKLIDENSTKIISNKLRNKNDFVQYRSKFG